MKLHLSDSLALPLNAVTQKLAFLGRTGSGKTYAATKLAEQMLQAGAQIVALDPVGVWWGLRLAADGKQAGLEIPVLGGLHGDIPLEPSAGKLVADLIIDRGISVVLDISQFEHDSDKARFVSDFAERFFYRKKSAPSAVHLFLEECQEFIPQNLMRGEEQMLHRCQRMWRLGRNFGIGGSLISQRPQDVSKKALNQAECVFAFQLTGPQERKAVDGWMSDKGLDLDLAADLPKLAVGQAHVWSPAWLRVSEVVRVASKQTFNASSTPEVGKSASARTLAPIDLEKLRTAMTATIERAKAEDPRELRKRIQELTAENGRLRSAKPATAMPDPEAIDRAVERERGKLVREFRRITEPFRGAVRKYAEALLAAIPAEMEWATAEAVRLSDPQPVEPQRSLSGLLSRHIRRDSPPAANRNGKERLPKGEHIVMRAIAQFGSVERDQLSVLSGYKRSTRDAYIQRLSERGYVEVSGSVIGATDAGKGALGADWEPLPTGRKLQEYWRSRLPEGERRVLEVLVTANGKSVQRDSILPDEYKRSSRDAYIQRLLARRLVVIESRGSVRASWELFE